MAGRHHLGDVRTPHRCLRGGLPDSLSLVLGVRLQHEIADAFLRTGLRDGTQQREAAALTVNRILARWECDVAASTGATLPDGEADQLQAPEYAVGEMQLGIGEFAGRVAFVVWDDLDSHNVTS